MFKVELKRKNQICVKEEEILKYSFIKMPSKQEQKQQQQKQQPKQPQSNPKGQQSNPKQQQSNPKEQPKTNPDDNKIVQIPLVTLKKFRGIFEVASNRANWRTDELLPVGLIVRDIDMLINHFSNPPNKEEKKEEKQNPKV